MVTDSTSQADDTTAFLRAARSGNLEKVVEYLDTDLDINTANSNGLNALHLASKDGHVEIVTELLKRSAKVDAATKKGNTALHIASLAGQAEIVKILIQYGAAVNIQSQNGFTPLYMAAQENHDQVVKLLLNNGANQSLATEDGFTPLAVAMQQGHDKVVSVLLENDSKGKVRLPALHIAAKKDDCKAADLLLQNDHKPDVTSKSGFTPLHIAAHYGNEEIARLLIKRRADVNYLAKHNISPLHVAAKWGKNNMVKILLENSAIIDAKTRDGLTPLHCAARSGHEEVVSTLLEHSAPISARTKNGLAPLHMASQGDHVEAARVLLYHRAPVDEVTIDYLTSLHVAAHCGHVRVAKLLLDRKADPNARALNGFTPLHIACKKNRIKVVELLLKHGASIESTTESGLTPLHVASFMGCMNIVIFLLQHEANPDVPTVRGETPLHLAARANQTDIIRILLRNGAKVDARAREQQTPLHIASRLGNIDIVMLLLQHGAAVDTATKDMYTALHIAAKEGQEEVAAFLVENNASLKATTKNGFTPLHIAAKYGNMNVAKILLQKDSKLDAQGKNDITPLHLACHYDHPNVANLLLDKGASPYLPTQNGHTPLHIAARKNQMDIASTLLEHGAKANAESKAGFTPLHLSAQKGHYDMTNLLIEHGADPNHKAKNGLTALHLCAQEDFIRVASILVKNGANVESQTETGYRPIHVAAHFGNLSMIRFLLKHNAEIDVRTNQNYTPLHQAAQQGHAHIVTALLEGSASHKARTNDGLTALNIAQKLGYISVIEVLKGLSYDSLTPDNKNWEEKYKVIAPESLHETSFMSDSDDEGGSDALISEQPYRYLTADLMKSLRDDSLPIDVTRDDPVHRPVSREEKQEFVQSNNYCMAESFDGTDAANLGRLHFRLFLVSFLVDARGGAMKGCRHSGIRIIVPPRRAEMPTRVTCRLVKPSKVANPPPLMDSDALATRIIEMGPVGASFLGPVLIDIPHFACLGKEREIIILRSENGESWKEHDNSDQDDENLLNTPFDTQMNATYSGRIIRIITTHFPQYFAIITRFKQEVHGIGADGGILISSVANHVQAVFPPGALTKPIKVALQVNVIPAELTAKLLGNCVAVSPVITIEPRRRKFHKPITVTIPVPQAANKGMINQYGGETPTLRLLCSLSGGTSKALWEDVTGSTPLTFMNDRVSFTTNVSARFWLMDSRNIAEVPRMAMELYKASLFVPFITNFVIYSKRMDILEATLRILCMTDGKEGMHSLEKQEEFLEIVKSRDVEVLDGRDLYIEFSGNLVPVTKSGVQLKFTFKAFRQNRLSFHVKVKDPLLDPVARMLFMKEPKVAKGEPPQQPICVLNIVLPEIMTQTSSKDYEDSNIISQKMDSYKAKYQTEGKEKYDEPKSPSEQKFITDTLQKEQTDPAAIHDSFAQKAASSPLESVDASYPNKVSTQEDDLSPVLEKQTYSEKRKFWEDITRKRDSYQRSESEVSRTSQLTINESDSECIQNVVSEEDFTTEAISGRSETMEDMNIPDISECSVAEKAHYFEEQIQREMSRAPAPVRQDSKEKEKEKEKGKAAGKNLQDEESGKVELQEKYLLERTKDEKRDSRKSSFEGQVKEIESDKMTKEEKGLINLSELEKVGAESFHKSEDIKREVEEFLLQEKKSSKEALEGASSFGKIGKLSKELKIKEELEFLHQKQKEKKDSVEKVSKIEMEQKESKDEKEKRSSKIPVFEKADGTKETKGQKEDKETKSPKEKVSDRKELLESRIPKGEDKKEAEKEKVPIDGKQKKEEVREKTKIPSIAKQSSTERISKPEKPKDLFEGKTEKIVTLETVSSSKVSEKVDEEKVEERVQEKSKIPSIAKPSFVDKSGKPEESGSEKAVTSEEISVGKVSTKVDDKTKEKETPDKVVIVKETHQFVVTKVESMSPEEKRFEEARETLVKKETSSEEAAEAPETPEESKGKKESRIPISAAQAEKNKFQKTKEESPPKVTTKIEERKEEVVVRHSSSPPKSETLLEKKKEFESKIPKRVSDVTSKDKKEFETVTITEKKLLEEVKSQQIEEHVRKTTSASQTFSKTFTGDPKDAFKMFEGDLSDESAPKDVTVTSRVDHKALTKVEKTEKVSSEILAGDEILEHEEKEHVEKKKLTESKLTEELKGKNEERKSEDIVHKTETMDQMTIQKAVLDSEKETVDATARQSTIQEKTDQRIKSVEDQQGKTVEEFDRSKMRESEIEASVKLKKEDQKDQVIASSFQESHRESSEESESTQFLPKGGEKVVKLLPGDVEKSKAWEVAENVVQSIEKEIQKRAETTEGLRGSSLDGAKTGKSPESKPDTDDDDELADDLTKKFERIMQKSQELEEMKTRTSIQEENSRDSISISEDLTKDEESSAHDRESSASALSSSQAKTQDRDMTVSPSSISEQIELEETIDLEDTSKHTLSSQSEQKEPVREVSQPDEKVASEEEKPREAGRPREDSVDVPSLEMDEQKSFEPIHKPFHESQRMESFDRISHERDITISPSTVSEDTNIDYSLPQEYVTPGLPRRSRKGDSFEIESPPLVSPRLKRHDLEIKSVNWMIGDEKIEISETLQPSQAFNKELEEYESSLKPQKFGFPEEEKQEVPSVSLEEVRKPEGGVSKADVASVEKKIVVTKPPKFTIIPVSEADLESELVENKLDISCQELMDTLQREYDAKTPTEDYMEPKEGRFVVEKAKQEYIEVESVEEFKIPPESSLRTTQELDVGAELDKRKEETIVEEKEKVDEEEEAGRGDESLPKTEEIKRENLGKTAQDGFDETKKEMKLVEEEKKVERKEEVLVKEKKEILEQQVDVKVVITRPQDLATESEAKMDQEGKVVEEEEKVDEDSMKKGKEISQKVEILEEMQEKVPESKPLEKMSEPEREVSDEDKDLGSEKVKETSQDKKVAQEDEKLEKMEDKTSKDLVSRSDVRSTGDDRESKVDEKVAKIEEKGKILVQEEERILQKNLVSEPEKKIDQHDSIVNEIPKEKKVLQEDRKLQKESIIEKDKVEKVPGEEKIHEKAEIPPQKADVLSVAEEKVEKILQEAEVSKKEEISLKKEEEKTSQKDEKALEKDEGIVEGDKESYKKEESPTVKHKEETKIEEKLVKLEEKDILLKEDEGFASGKFEEKDTDKASESKDEMAIEQVGKKRDDKVESMSEKEKEVKQKEVDESRAKSDSEAIQSTQDSESIREALKLIDDKLKGWEDAALSSKHKHVSGEEQKKRLATDAHSAFKVRKEEHVDLSAKYAITVLDQVVKKEIAEVKESLEAARQDLIEELSENSETVIQIKDSPSEFQFKLQPESIPNDLPFLYRPPSLEQEVEHGATEKTKETTLDSQKEEVPVSAPSTGTPETESVTVTVQKVEETSKLESDVTEEEFDLPEETSTTQPVAASRSSTDVETKDSSTLIPPQPAPRRRQKPSRASKKVTSDSEGDLGSSSGESSNYQSCGYEIGSGSRPSSSDVEALQSAVGMSGTASEYETALMSIEHSSKATSQDYYTAASTLSSRESMKSLNSLSSGHLGSIDSTGELSETLVPSEAELDKDDIDENLEYILEEDRQVKNSDSSSSENLPEDNVDRIDSDVPCRMKRSSEMIFQQVLDDEMGKSESPEIVGDEEEDDDDENEEAEEAEDDAEDASEERKDEEEGIEGTKDDFEVEESDEKILERISPMQTLTMMHQASMSTSSASGLSTETVIEREKSGKHSPDSDSFELVDKPDIIDDFVVIEEVGKEAEEFDSEGKSMKISSTSYVSSKNYDRELENLIAEKEKEVSEVSTSQTTQRNSELFEFETEESPPQASGDEQYSQSYSDEEQYDGSSKKWIEMQFHGDPHVYDIEYDRGPLEDIKEEEITDFEAGSSRFGSLGSHKESIGSVGSMKGSLGSTPDYDVLTGKRYFAKPEHDNISLSSLQEFENLESAVALENSRKLHSSSTDSTNNGSLPRRYMTGRSGHGDDVSLSSLKDFEGLEKACREAHLIELRAREEEDLLDHESPENRYKLEGLPRKAESSTAGSFNPSTSGSDDYEKRIKEIDEIIRIAQSNVEKFDRQDDTTEDISQIDLEKTGEQVATAAALPVEAEAETGAEAELVAVREGNVMETSTDSLELENNEERKYNPLCRSSDSLEMKTTLDYPSLSSDSLNNVRDSKEGQVDVVEFNPSRRISSDSLEMPLTEQQQLQRQQDVDSSSYSEQRKDSLESEVVPAGHVSIDTKVTISQEVSTSQTQTSKSHPDKPTSSGDK